MARNAFEELMLKADHSHDPDAELKFRKEFKAETERYYADKDRLSSEQSELYINTAIETDTRQLQFNFVLSK